MNKTWKRWNGCDVNAKRWTSGQRWEHKQNEQAAPLMELFYVCASKKWRRKKTESKRERSACNADDRNFRMLLLVSAAGSFNFSFIFFSVFSLSTRNSLYALATTERKKCTRQTKMNLVLFQGECGNKNKLDFHMHCSIWSLRMENKNDTEKRRCVCGWYINSLFGQALDAWTSSEMLLNKTTVNNTKNRQNKCSRHCWAINRLALEPALCFYDRVYKRTTPTDPVGTRFSVRVRVSRRFLLFFFFQTLR